MVRVVACQNQHVSDYLCSLRPLKARSGFVLSFFYYTSTLNGCRPFAEKQSLILSQAWNLPWLSMDCDDEPVFFILITYHDWLLELFSHFLFNYNDDNCLNSSACLLLYITNDGWNSSALLSTTSGTTALTLQPFSPLHNEGVLVFFSPFVHYMRCNCWNSSALHSSKSRTKAGSLLSVGHTTSRITADAVLNISSVFQAQVQPVFRNAKADAILVPCSHCKGDQTANIQSTHDCVITYDRHWPKSELSPDILFYIFSFHHDYACV